MESVTKEILYKLGITLRYKGYWYISYSMKLLLRDENYLLNLSASLYSEIAKHYNVSIHSVEYDIRTAIIVAWEANPELLEEIAKVKLYKAPANKDFLESLLSFIKSKEQS